MRNILMALLPADADRAPYARHGAGRRGDREAKDMRMRILGVVAAIAAVAGLGQAAQLIVWNLRDHDVAVAVDGVVQCTVQPHRVCVVDDIPPGTHTVSDESTIRYEEGSGKVAVGRPIELPRGDSWRKLCLFRTGLVPDECVAWVRDGANLLPSGVDAVHVAYRWRSP